jgi:ABC-2 type transport system permease protein
VTASVLDAPGPHLAPHNVRVIAAQARVLSRRSIVGLFRQPSVWVPGIFFPMFLAAVNTSAMGRAIHIPGFPKVDSMLDFYLAASVTQAVLFGGINAGADTAIDISTGFFDRLLASPVSRTAILVGRLAGSAVFGLVQAAFFIVVYGIFGVTIEGGIPGLLVVLVYAVLLSLVIGGFGAMLALRTGQAEAVQNVFPLLFILMFVSSAFFPTELMRGIYQTIAERNPVTWMIDGVRHQIIVGFDATEAAKALGIAAVLAALMIAWANAALRARLRAAQ